MLGRSDGHIRELYLVDESGKRIAVVLPIEEYERLLEALEELDDIRAYQEAIESGEEAISVDNFIAEIENDQQRAMSSASCAGRGRRSSGYRLLGAKDCTPAGGHPADWEGDEVEPCSSM